MSNEKKKLDKNSSIMLVFGHVSVVSCNGRELQMFCGNKQANAYVLHNYGPLVKDKKPSREIWSNLTEEQAESTIPTSWWLRELDHQFGVKVEEVDIEKRGPQIGDSLVYNGDGDWYSNGFGIIDQTYDKNSLSVTFNASCFRDEESLSNSGGPSPHIYAEDLTFIGLRTIHCWRWNKGYGGGGQGGEYQMTVPCWKWNGRTKKHD